MAEAEAEAEAGVRDMRRRSKANHLGIAEDKIRVDIIQNDTSRSGTWDTKTNLSKARTNSLWGNNNNKIDSKVGDDVTPVEDTRGHKSENTNVNQSKKIESSGNSKKPVENSSLGLPVLSGMCVSKSHRQPLTGSSSMEYPAALNPNDPATDLYIISLLRIRGRVPRIVTVNYANLNPATDPS
ncbi:hypothetical protein PIB30_005087 [Stylosanthes scabra]|uniref:Uncharacterized protein n=1 Tax=Stylosanthes scabra TaxID=79078 RepID=A0ABU6Q4K7_9FABA|nr:hypothetical protein [Stylosanthes scabra]